MGALTTLILNGNVGNGISNVGNGISNPNTCLYISTNAGNGVNSFAIRVSSGGRVDETVLATLIGLGAESD